MSGGLVVITTDTTRAQIEQEIGRLRTLQLAAVIPSTAREHADEMDRLTDAWIEASA